MSHVEVGTLKLESRECDIKLINFQDNDEPPEEMAWMVIPHAYLHSLPMRVQWIEDVISAESGTQMDVSMLVETRGVVLDDPLNDPVPDRSDFLQNPDDPRFWDQDQDGKPGITMLMDGMMRGEIYHVQRITAKPNGTLIDKDHIRGLCTVTTEMEYLDASNPDLLADIDFLVHEEADRTFFRLMRMPDDTSCADLIREGSRNDSWIRHSNHMMDVPDP